jgi:hypothetical protein
VPVQQRVTGPLPEAPPDKGLAAIQGKGCATRFKTLTFDAYAGAVGRLVVGCGCMVVQWVKVALNARGEEMDLYELRSKHYSEAP